MTHSSSPEPVSAELTVLQGIRDDFARLTSVVIAERRGRRSSTTLALVCLAALLVASVLWGLDARREASITCAQRTESRIEIRAAIEAGVDEVADFGELAPDRRNVLTARVERRILDELPPPAC
jgi:hypothetical protein